MRIIIKHILLIFFGILLLPNHAWSQETENLPNAEPENVTDAFQENFFEALKQKGIENYELALIALNKAEKAAKSEENKAVVYFEMGKNNTYLKKYAEAEELISSASRTIEDNAE